MARARTSGGPGNRLPLMAGNWKMHENHLEAIALVQKLAFTLTAKDFEAVEVAVLPPFTALRSVQTLIDGDKLRLTYGAQDISRFDSGAYTGDVSGPMLAKLGCQYVLAGHSERRQYHGETDDVVNAKALAALRSGLTPILCLGEPLEVRQARQQLGHCMGQLDEGLKGFPADAVAAMVIAYEPVWAIGTGYGGHPGRRAGDVRGDQVAGFGVSWRRNGRQCAYPVWRVRQARQHRADHGAAGRRRRPRRRGQPRRRAVRSDLPVS